MSTQYLLIKPDTAERYDLWGREGVGYFNSRFSSMSLKARGLTDGIRFRIRDAYPPELHWRDIFILTVSHDVCQGLDGTVDEILSERRREAGGWDRRVGGRR